MLRRVLLWLSALMVLGAALALAEETVVGTWEAAIETPRGTNEIVMEFTDSDGALQGKWTGRRGTEELADVKFEGGHLTFTRNLEFKGNSFSIDYDCTIDGNTMNGKISTPRGEREFTAKRSG